METKTPDELAAAIHEIQEGLGQAPTLLFAAEEKLAKAKLDRDLAEAKVLLEAQGTVIDRQAVAKIKTSDFVADVDLAARELSRVKVWIDISKTRLSALQTEAGILRSLYGIN